MAVRRKKRKVNLFRLLIAMAVPVLLIMAAVRLLYMLFHHEEAAAVPEEVITVYSNDYDWSFLSIDDRGFCVYEDEKYTSRTGIDVSFNQGTIDWQKVRDDGIDFAVIRVGYRGYESGELHEDTSFRTNMNGAALAGIEKGVYFFSQAVSEEEAAEEAEYVLSLISEYRVDLPIVYDMETVTDHDRIASLTSEEKTAIARAFAERIKKAGYEPMIYGSDYWLQTIHMEQLQDICTFWMAHYTQTVPDASYQFEIWQYTEKGEVDGIDVPVDMDLMFVRK